jgi:hypothetical protein
VLDEGAALLECLPQEKDDVLFVAVLGKVVHLHVKLGRVFDLLLSLQHYNTRFAQLQSNFIIARPPICSHLCKHQTSEILGFSVCSRAIIIKIMENEMIRERI